MDMESRKLSHEEITHIAMSSADTISKKLEDSAIIIPKLVKAVVEFYSLLVNAGRIERDDTESRDIIVEMFLEDMKTRAEFLPVAE